ncbi:MAG: hypothetical protein A2X12_11240 [Bacteroidetes bacterium GWE2_29_8]|nr:MAG: hypothetical protein A2X12_11240 [Bacteroidetes bacterium GWE2_29_8]
MIIKLEDQIKQLLDEKFKDTYYYYISVKLNSRTKDILISVDNDKSITIKECTDIHRYLKKNIGETLENYNVEVSSPGLMEAIVDDRQYNKRIGKYLEIITKDNENFTGKVVGIDDNYILLEVSVKPKSKNKAIKATDVSIVKIDKININIAKEVITF